MIFGFLRKLGSGGAGGDEPPRPGEACEYKGFHIQPRPQKDGSQWRVAAVITREVEGVEKSYSFVRADTFADREFTVEMCVTKAQRIIDERGERLLEE